jgi:KUP system potassium uptake protein
MGHGNGEPKDLRKLVLAAIGVVYGDIGTSPLYAMKESFHGHHLEGSVENVYGVLSLILWTLIILVTVKYLLFVTRANNQGEGGILALMALVRPKEKVPDFSSGWLLVVLGIFGASLLYGDGVITPAISVLSAVEGLQLVAPSMASYVLPITIIILVVLFALQERGTAGVGAIFGPVMVVWFLTLATLGLYNIVQAPGVLVAMWPGYGVQWLFTHGWHGFLVLGSVFLVCTGGESLYADMGHFGREPIQKAWFFFVWPALVLNYFGQGALFIAHPESAELHPFFGLAPKPLLLPLVVLAAAAAVIASQALISGVFSLTRQAIQLGYAPRVRIEHTSAEEIGQIYVPSLNWALCAACIAVVLGFGSSTALASAYGIAVVTTMIITTSLSFVVAATVWKWRLPFIVGMWVVFLVCEIGFWAANMTKVAEGGWFPLLLGVMIFTLMTTWNRGRALLAERLRDQSMPFDVFRRVIAEDKPYRAPRTAVFMTSDRERVPPALFRNLVHNRVLHERVLLVTVLTVEVPYVPNNERMTVTDMGDSFWRITVRYGFMEQPNVPRLLETLPKHGVPFDPEETTWFLGRETILPTDAPGMALWREFLFAAMVRNAQPATAYYRIPPAFVVEIGSQIEM